MPTTILIIDAGNTMRQLSLKILCNILCIFFLFFPKCTLQSEDANDLPAEPPPEEKRHENPEKLNHKPPRHHAPHAQGKGHSRSVDVPNPNSIFNREEADEAAKHALNDPITRQIIQQRSGPIDAVNDATGGCLSSGSRYPTINLHADHESHDENTEPNKTKELHVNRLYGVKRDRFYVQNVASSMMSVQFRDGEATTEATVRGLEEDWNSEYVLAKADLFWSQDNNYGAQHSIGKQTYPFEIQLVHYRKDLNSLNEASSKKHGILVFSLLFQAVGHANPDLEPLATAAVHVPFPSSKLENVHGPIIIKNLFPFDLSNLQYTGAYMGQPCAREAKWVVFRHIGHVAAKQLKKFRLIRDVSAEAKVGVFLIMPDSEVPDKEVVVSNDVHMKILTTEENSRGNVIQSFWGLVLCLISILFA